MPTCLDPIWAAYQASRNSLKVVRRCLSVPGIDRERAFRNTLFHRQPDAECERLLVAAERDLSEAAVLSLYARFEARLREHLAEQGTLLAGAPGPDPQFGNELASLFVAECDGFKMDAVAGLYASAVGATAVQQVANVRAYRHWLAHGRAWARPPAVTPLFTFSTLAGFLTAAGLT